MARFGGASQFGAGAQFGGSEAWNIRILRSLRQLMPPGVYSEEPGTLHDDRLWSLAKLLELGQSMIDAARRELFPGSAEETIPEWQELLRLTLADDMSVSDKQALLRSKWSAANSSSLADLRHMLVDVLNPTTAFHDEFDDADVSFRYVQDPNNGSISEAGGNLTLGVTSPTHGEIDGSNENAPLCHLEVVDRSDGFELEATTAGYTTNNETEGGLICYQDSQTMIGFRLYTTGGATRLRGWKMIGGVRSDFTETRTLVGHPTIMKIHRVGTVIYLRYEDPGGDGTLTTIVQDVDFPVVAFRPKYLTMYAANESPWNTAQIQLSAVSLRYATQRNNVEIVETPVGVVAASNPEHVFEAFIVRRHADPGSYSLAAAQRIADLASQAHAVVRVGEEEQFRCDDLHSLCDRDVIGA